MEDQIKRDAERHGLGATGRFPVGKLKKNDEGELKTGVTVVNNKLIISFGKPVAWIGMTKAEAEQLRDFINKRLPELK